MDRGALTVLHSEIQERKDAELAVDSPALGHTQTDHGRRVGGVCRRAEIIVAVVCPALAAVASRQTRGVRPGDCDALPLSWPNIAKLISSSLSCNQGVASNPDKTREHHPTIFNAAFDELGFLSYQWISKCFINKAVAVSVFFAT